MAKRRKLWNPEDIPRAIEEHENGERISVFCKKYGIPERTLRRKLQRANADIPERSPGPSPVLGGAETDIYAWVVAMQHRGYSVSRAMLLIKGQQVYRAMFGPTRTAGTIGIGWCERFLHRHPSLSLRNAQLIKRVCNNVAEDDVVAIFNRCLQAIVETGACADRIYNVDETAFVHNGKTKK
ncbi:TPA: hypothetical protein N0F65_006578 [Lagenidium giganteum]|uniref:HTH CENPB-type domain-containing protein n=1 Tax=Lagenidium giganteum TaxID=4803 RepID=A0AAV2Z5W5_9STRA|nr:TPA: hypothetical protein N0F65_006578 [Lagenidium giganteum]